MAITILQQPSNGCALSRPNFIYLNSNLASSWSDFRYIIHIYYTDPDSATPNQPIHIGQFRFSPDPLSKKGMFDISKIALNYFNHKFKGNFEVVAWQTDKINVSLSYSFGEYYNGSEHFPIQATNYLKAYYYYTDILASVITPSYPSTYIWLTDRDITKIVAPKKRNIYLPFNNIYSGSVVNQVLYYYNWINGIQNDDGPITIGLSKQCVEVNLNSLALNFLVYNNDAPSIDRYDIEFSKPMGEQSTQATINYICTKNNDMQIHFLNRFGAWETMSFSAINREETESERRTFKSKGITALNSSIIDYSGYVSPTTGFTTYVKDRKETVFFDNVKTKYTLVSDYVNEQDYKWLQQLINTPSAYVEKYNGNFTLVYPCIIETSQWKQKFSGADKIFNLEITISVGEQLI